MIRTTYAYYGWNANFNGNWNAVNHQSHQKFRNQQNTVGVKRKRHMKETED